MIQEFQEFLDWRFQIWNLVNVEPLCAYKFKNL